MELSEPITAAWLYYSEADLYKIAGIKKIGELDDHEMSYSGNKKSLKAIIGDKKGKFQSAISKHILYGGGGDQSIAIKSINDVLNKGKSSDYEKIVMDCVKGLSAAIAIYKWMKSGRHKKTSGKKIKQVYITGGTWHKNIAKFNVKVPGMQAYNSSDLVIEKPGNIYFGVSLKKKGVTEGSPTLINNSVAEVLKTFKEADTKGSDISILTQVDRVRLQFIGSIITTNDFLKVLNKGAVGIPKVDLKLGGKRPATNKADKGSFPGKKGLTLIKGKQRGWKSKIKGKKTSLKELDKIIKEKPTGDYQYKGSKSKAFINIDGFRNPFAKDAGIPSFGSTGTVRAFVNRQYGDKESAFWQELKKIFTANNENVKNVSEKLASRVLKFELPEELDKELKKNKYHFGFSLVTGIGDVNIKKDTFRVREGHAYDVHTIICSLAEVYSGEGKAKGDYRIVWDTAKNSKSTKANIWLKLVKGKLPILNMEIRYKGSFTSWPQFQAKLSKEFESLLGTGHCIT